MILTIGGMPGAGKSTIAKMLAEKLSFPRYYMGGIFREMAAKRNMDINEFYKVIAQDPSIDQGVDNYQRRLGQTKDNFILEGRMSFHFIPHSLKLFFKVDPLIAANRIFDECKGETSRGENYSSLDEVVSAIKERLNQESERYLSLYGVNHVDESNFDIVIDTSEKSINEVFLEIYNIVLTHQKSVSNQSTTVFPVSCAH